MATIPEWLCECCPLGNAPVYLVGFIGTPRNGECNACLDITDGATYIFDYEGSQDCSPVNDPGMCTWDEMRLDIGSQNCDEDGNDYHLYMQGGFSWPGSGAAWQKTDVENCLEAQLLKNVNPGGPPCDFTDVLAIVIPVTADMPLDLLTNPARCLPIIKKCKYTDTVSPPDFNATGNCEFEIECCCGGCT